MNELSARWVQRILKLEHKLKKVNICWTFLTLWLLMGKAWLFLNDPYEVIYKAFCLDVAQGCMNGAPNETQTNSWEFPSLAC